MDSIVIFNFVLNLLQIIGNIDNCEGGRNVSQEDTWSGEAIQFPVWIRGA
jgi:hypothetical protein